MCINRQAIGPEMSDVLSLQGARNHLPQELTEEHLRFDTRKWAGVQQNYVS